MKYEIEFDNYDMVAKFYADLKVSAEFAQDARKNANAVDCARYVTEFCVTIKMLSMFGADPQVFTGTEISENNLVLDVIKLAEIYMNGERYVIVRNGELDEPVLRKVLFKFAGNGESR